MWITVSGVIHSFRWGLPLEWGGWLASGAMTFGELLEALSTAGLKALAGFDEGVRKFVCEALIEKEFHR